MKRYIFNLSDSLYDEAKSPIRTKADLLRLLAHTIKFLIYQPVENVDGIAEDHKLILYVDKMSRLFFCIKDKIFSFKFPFHVKVDSEDNILSIWFKDYFEFDNITSSLLLAVLEQDSIFDKTLENINEKVAEEIEQNEWENIDIVGFNKLLTQLMLFEPGYLRYDHDMKNANGKKHPEHHLDIFYSSNVTMKLGLKQNIKSEWFIDLVNILTDCKYIV